MKMKKAPIARGLFEKQWDQPQLGTRARRARRERFDGAARRVCFDALAVAGEAVTSSFTTLAFLALLRVLIRLFFWMDTVDSPRLNFFFRPTHFYVAWRVPNSVRRMFTSRIDKNRQFW